MTVTGMLSISGQGMIPVPRLKRFVLCQKSNNPFEFIQLLSPLGYPFQVS